MKVNNSSTKPSTAATTQAASVETNAKTKSKNKTGLAEGLESLGSSRVNVSDKAQAFQKAKAIASQESVDEAKIARLQKMIDEGKYRVDAAAVSDRLVDEHLLMARNGED